MLIALIVSCAIAFISSLIALIANRMIAANIYTRTVLGETLEKSPYGLQREKSNRWGYCITKRGEVMYNSDGKAELYHELGSAIEAMNVLEKIGGYKLTRV